MEIGHQIKTNGRLAGHGEKSRGRNEPEGFRTQRLSSGPAMIGGIIAGRGWITVWRIAGLG